MMTPLKVGNLVWLDDRLYRVISIGGSWAFIEPMVNGLCGKALYRTVQTWRLERATDGVKGVAA